MNGNKNLDVKDDMTMPNPPLSCGGGPHRCEKVMQAMYKVIAPGIETDSEREGGDGGKEQRLHCHHYPLLHALEGPFSKFLRNT